MLEWEIGVAIFTWLLELPDVGGVWLSENGGTATKKWGVQYITGGYEVPNATGSNAAGGL